MAVWTEYEGKTIDGAFPLNRLLRPEGASAFFTTTKDGLARIIRLIEARSDRDEVLSRWRGVDALDHPNILRFESYGQVVIDHATLLYAVMEPVDANLGDIIGAQRLTVEDTRQLAISLLSVLEALHAHGFVHGHIEPARVVAVHHTVKLQCDSICDAPEGQQGLKLKQRDVQDLAALILLALTGERDLDAAAAQFPLPAPFDSIVKKGMSGEWGVAEVSDALQAVPESMHQTPAPAADAASVSAAALPSPQMPLFAEKTAAGLPPEDISTVDEDIQTTSANKASDEEREDLAVFRIIRWLVASLVVVLLVVLVATWPLMRSAKPEGKARPVATPSNSPATAQQPSPQPTAPSVAPSEASPSPAPIPAAVGAQWRVIAYSYRREARARRRANRIARRHPALQPEVFRPTASGRYLVSVGGLLTGEQAKSLAKDLHHEGFPRKTHAQVFAAAE
jgi:eukaryotic-like serine/threonine-protein kinase